MCECADVRMCEFFRTDGMKEFAHPHICTFAHFPYFFSTVTIE